MRAFKWQAAARKLGMARGEPARATGSTSRKRGATPIIGKRRRTS